MQQKEDDRKIDVPKDEEETRTHEADHDPEHPTPDIEHYPEPDAENLIPVKDKPGTL